MRRFYGVLLNSGCVSLFALSLLYCTALANAHRSGHRHSNRYSQAADQQQQQSASEEAKQPDPQTVGTSTMATNGDNYLKFTEFLHLNFSHSKQFSGLPTSNTAATLNNPSSFDPFAALRQLLPSLPAPPNWNTWTQVQTSQGRLGMGGPQPEQQQIQLPNIVPMGQTNVVNKPRNGFNNNYNYNFGKDNVDRYGVDLSSHGNSPATTGFPGSANLRGLTPTEKSTYESSERLPSEKLPPMPFKPKRPNSSSKSMEKSSERLPALPQRNITAYWIF